MSLSPPWYRHPLDRVLVPLFATFFVTSLVFDRLAALDLVAPDSADILGRALWAYGNAYDPLVAENPLFLRVMSGISAFLFGPFYVVVIYALIRRRNWIRTPAFIYAISILYSMVVHVAVELLWPRPPPHLAMFAAVYLGYALAPLALIWRLRRPNPFG